MSQTANNPTVWPMRTLPKDIGVGIVILIALAAGLLLRLYIEGSSKEYKSTTPPFSMSYPSTWRAVQSSDGSLVHVENPTAGSAYKTNITVMMRELDPSSPPTLQELIDRRVGDLGNLTGYHFLSSSESNMGGAKAEQLEYAYVVQPIDTPRSASLPAVVHSKEYIVVTQNRTYYITLAAAESDYSKASNEFDRVIQTVKLQ